MDRSALVRDPHKHSLGVELLRNAIVRLTGLAATSVQSQESEGVLPTCLDMLQEALSSMREAAGILQTVAANADSVLPVVQSDGNTAPDSSAAQQQAAEQPQDAALERELQTIEQLLNSTVASCLRVRHILVDHGGRVLFKSTTKAGIETTLATPEAARNGPIQYRECSFNFCPNSIDDEVRDGAPL